MVKIIMHGCNGKMGQVITGIVAADEAIKDAGLDSYDGDKERIGVSIGSGIGGLNTIYDYSEYISGIR